MHKFRRGYVASIGVLVALFFVSAATLAVADRQARNSTLFAISPRLADTNVDLVQNVSTPDPQDKLEQQEVETTAPAVSTSTVVASSTSTSTPSTPYSLTYSGVDSDLSFLGYSLSSLRSQGIEVMGHNGAIPKRCSSGQTGSTYTSGIAIKTAATYTPCADGGQPIYEAYRPAGYSCVVIYNRQSPVSRAILAHEIGHCLHFTYGQYRSFDIDYKQIRDTSGYNRSQVNELVAEDFMICYHGLDTNYGAGSYYARYGAARPTSLQCAQINAIVSEHLIR